MDSDRLAGNVRVGQARVHRTPLRVFQPEAPLWFHPARQRLEWGFWSYATWIPDRPRWWNPGERSTKVLPRPRTDLVGP